MATLNLTIKRGTTFGPVLITAKYGNGAVVPLAGYTAYAEARKGPGSAVVIDFAPVIEDDDADGLITIPAIPYADTADLPSCSIPWDLILEAPDGTRATEPLLEGRVSINQIITQPA
jgi:hypothetical protein